MQTPAATTTMAAHNSRAMAWLALAALVPSTSLGVLTAMVWWPDTAWGQSLFLVAKLWTLGLPVAWWLVIERQPLRWPRWTRAGLAAGVWSGLALGGAIAAAWFTVGRALIDTTALRAALHTIGLGSPAAYLAFAVWMSLGNSLGEEYVWRWFVVRQARQATQHRAAAVLLGASAFTIHHVISLAVLVPDGRGVALASAAVFLGGVVWSWLYARTGSIAPTWVSHVIADVVIVAIGWTILVG